jgi:hypothetical protein
MRAPWGGDQMITTNTKKTASKRKEITIKIASQLEEWKQGLHLLHTRLTSWGLIEEQPHKMWLNKFFLLPTTTLIVAKAGREVIGAVALFGNGAFGLPLERNYQGAFSLGAEDVIPERVAELSPVAVQRGLETLVALPLLSFAFQYSTTHCRHELLVTESWNNESAGFWSKLGFQPLPRVGSSRIAMYAQSPAFLAQQDFFTNAKERANCYFPDRKFFRVCDTVLTPDILDELFIRQSNILHQLSDQELRALRNIYGFGPLSSHLPHRNSQENYKSQPRFQRFDVDCDGFLLLPDSRTVNFTVQDVSVKGLKIRTDQPIQMGMTYVMHINTGVWRESEVIARAVWTNNDCIGFELENVDKVWLEMIEHLRDASRNAA